ncbi:heme-dependent oxidative N-demethylase family protein [Aspergillus stella-maris]|uniref:heme-dependent oxidative N-demethylase family protein n=1 Tax=Aspergillus stella-maris TaxID=1810926 RepID=UPI003CCCB728
MTLDLSLSSLLAHAPLIFFSTVFICFFIIYITGSFKKASQYDLLNQEPVSQDAKTPIPASESGWGTEHGYPPLTPLPSSEFNWETTEPLVFRPFKPKYHLTMGITPCDYNELIPMDKTYLERLSLRHELLKEYPDVVRGVDINPDQPDPVMDGRIKDALCEWYAYVMGVYLPERYPGMFVINSEGEGVDEGNKEKGKGKMLKSLVTGLTAPINPKEAMDSISSSATNGTVTTENEKLLHLLDTLGSWVDEDFLILLPKPTSPPNQEPKYHLSAYTTYYPAGFDTRTKLGQPLNKIHAPVPRYESKLEKSMDRFFGKLEVGRAVVRVNWSIMTQGTGLFCAFGGLHSYTSSQTVSSSSSGEGAGGQEEVLKADEVDGSETFLRCERQTLHRLPKSKALLFGFHTYTYPLDDIKQDGLGEELATAIEGLKSGSVPEVYGYKRGEYWGEGVKAFLRS